MNHITPQSGIPTNLKRLPCSVTPPCFRLEGRPYGFGKRASLRAARPGGCVIGPPAWFKRGAVPG
jgi:hypothetical protein